MQDPNTTMMVVKDGAGHVLERIPATAKGAEERLQRLSVEHQGVTVDYEQDENAPLLAAMHRR